ncbi:hypothetical protein DVH24_020263 [Malus domestica]|uniref:Uncharacterized protein n=1 Tax=Malus domestica TaxID=3750 RepID=A0A498J6U5_MALDO|nr:hypothetical protein DVH24_020263 [Malus domestica]
MGTKYVTSQPGADHFLGPLHHRSTILSALGLPFPYGFVFGNSRVTYPRSALTSFSLNFGVLTEPEASELPKGLVLGKMVTEKRSAKEGEGEDETPITPLPPSAKSHLATNGTSNAPQNLIYTIPDSTTSTILQPHQIDRNPDLHLQEQHPNNPNHPYTQPCHPNDFLFWIFNPKFDAYTPTLRVQQHEPSPAAIESGEFTPATVPLRLSLLISLQTLNGGPAIL